MKKILWALCRKHVGYYFCLISGKIILYFEYKNNRHLMNTYILMHLHFTGFHGFAVHFSVRVVLMLQNSESQQI